MTIAAWFHLRRSLYLGLVCLLTQTALAAPAIDWEKVQKETVQKFKAGAPITWTATHKLDATTSIRVQVTVAGSMRRSILTQIDGEDETAVADIIARDELWYVDADGSQGRWRPFETIFSNPAVYSYLQISEPQVVNPREMDRLESIEDGVAKARQPHTVAVQNQMRQMVTKLKAALAAAPLEQQEQLEMTIETLNDNITKGATLAVDVATAIILKQFTPGRETEFSQVRWLEKPDETAFDVSSREWRDRTAPITTSNNLDLAMFSYVADAVASKNMRDAVLFNLASSQMVRVPIPLPFAVPGCFTKDRKRVLLLAAGVRGGLALYQVDLATRAVEMIDTASITSGIVADPTLSPQGQWLGLLHKPDQSQPEWQVCALNLKTADLRMLGRPLNCANLSWFPDTSGVLLARHEFAGFKKPPKSTISKLDLKGKLTPIRRGSAPFLLSGAKRILYQGNEGDTLWYTCALDGSDPQLIGDGLEGCHDPSVSIDERQLLMVKGADVATALPIKVELKTGAATLLNVPGGSYLTPVWR